MALKVFLCLTVLTTCYIFGGAYIFILLEAGAANEHVSGADGGTNISSTQAFQDFLGQFFFSLAPSGSVIFFFIFFFFSSLIVVVVVFKEI